ncbi:uncharacterized protein BX664DRAFT_323979 [Halteromyces radiatus]|uniref:uncharacterized protein n=1 Tax=Halteromyces radiatus TaxID=101107 RepID=UPI002220B9CA|nr:uncharacterized protein BX664DRAFT_323979 [Halteromyces radiatus]KAI8096431.1 hypothetical protein BX664DRAFT_323979 [Halteromyces radiatus]
MLMPSSSSYMSLGSRSESGHFRLSSSLSGSISMFLRKASSSTTNNKRTPAIPDGPSRSFGRQGLDKTHRLAHSMHWSTLQPHQLQQPQVSSTISSFSPTPSLRHQHYRHRQNHHRYKPSSSSSTYHMPLPSRITPMIESYQPTSSPSMRSLRIPSPVKATKKQRSLFRSQSSIKLQQSTPCRQKGTFLSTAKSIKQSPFASRIPRQSITSLKDPMDPVKRDATLIFSHLKTAPTTPRSSLSTRSLKNKSSA